eukprot:snap_masked-scaffold_18-processed-gene-5.19-mRNA-1 protein AED:1.00 eAED:1.00 QI:0/0/0/0/1/1/2/0/721
MENENVIRFSIDAINTTFVDVGPLLKKAEKDKKSHSDENKMDIDQVKEPSSFQNMQGINGLAATIAAIERKARLQESISASGKGSNGPPEVSVGVIDNEPLYSKEENLWFKEGKDFIDDTEFDAQEEMLDVQQSTKLKFAGFFVHKGPLKNSLSRKTPRKKAQSLKKQKLSEVTKAMQFLREYCMDLSEKEKNQLKTVFPTKLDQLLIDLQKEGEAVPNREESLQVIVNAKKELKTMLGITAHELTHHFRRIKLITEVRSKKGKYYHQFRVVKDHIQKILLHADQDVLYFAVSLWNRWEQIYTALFDAIGEDIAPYLNKEDKPNLDKLEFELKTTSEKLLKIYGEVASFRLTETLKGFAERLKAEGEFVRVFDKWRNIESLAKKMLEFTAKSETLIGKLVWQKSYQLSGVCACFFTRTREWLECLVAPKTLAKPIAPKTWFLWNWPSETRKIFRSLLSAYKGWLTMVNKLRDAERRVFSKANEKTTCLSKTRVIHSILNLFQVNLTDVNGALKPRNVTITATEIIAVVVREYWYLPENVVLEGDENLLKEAIPVQLLETQNSIIQPVCSVQETVLKTPQRESAPKDKRSNTVLKSTSTAALNNCDLDVASKIETPVKPTPMSSEPDIRLEGKYNDGLSDARVISAKSTIRSGGLTSSENPSKRAKKLTSTDSADKPEVIEILDDTPPRKKSKVPEKSSPTIIKGFTLFDSVEYDEFDFKVS